jgi:hypothetical protein
MKKILIIVLAVVIALGTVACNKKKEGSKVVSRTNRGYMAGSNLTAPSGQAIGWDALDNSPITSINSPNIIYESLNLLTASVPRDQIGNLTGDVRMAMNLRVNQGGQIDPNDSRIGMVFWDDYSVYGGADPLTILMDAYVNSSAQGEVRGTNIYVTFTDQYGQIIVSGQIQGNTISGQIRYQNFGSKVRTLGSFQLPKSGTLR